MRFQRFRRYSYTATARKSAAILRRQQAERNRLPLFADEIASTQRSVDAEHGHRAQAWEAAQLEQRAMRAGLWRRARTELNRFDPGTRALLARYWNHNRWYPGTPEYLLSVLHMHREGRLNLDVPGMLSASRVSHLQAQGA